jgi:hypothetical protein
MVGVRFRRALFPAFSDTVEYQVPSARPGKYQVTVKLLYRKVDQFLVNYLLGEDSGITAPVVEIDRATASIDVPAGEAAGARLIPAND